MSLYNYASDELQKKHPKLFVGEDCNLYVAAISLWQPWASAIVTGHPKYPGTGIKEWETRGWKLPDAYVGKIVLVHAALKMNSELARVYNKYPFYEYSSRLNNTKHFGAIIGGVEPIKCISTEEFVSHHTTGRSIEELQMGDYTSGRFAWQLQKPFILPSPVIPYRGNRKFWKIKLDDLPAETHSFILGIK